MDELLKRHIVETDRKFEELQEDVALLVSKIDDLRDFKIRLLVSSRFFSMIIGAICGAISLLASSFVTYYVNIKLNKG